MDPVPFLYSTITSTKSPSLCMTTFSASLANITVFLAQSHHCSCYVSGLYWHLNHSDCRNTLIYAHAISRTPSTCDMSLSVPEAGDFVELILLCLVPATILAAFPYNRHISSPIHFGTHLKPNPSPWLWRKHVTPKRPYKFKILYRVITQNTVICKAGNWHKAFILIS